MANSVPISTSIADVATGHRARGRDEPSFVVPAVDTLSMRQKRKRLLDQHRMVWGGAASVHSLDLECGPFDENFVDALKVSYPGRSYYGAPSHECANCHAVFWFAERVNKDSRQGTKKVVYNKCCRGGKIKLPSFKPHPEPLASLAKFDGGPVSNKFMRSIRQYNCLFAFTSMGANIDRSMNDGRGPPVFKICGQIHHRIGSLLPYNGQKPK